MAGLNKVSTSQDSSNDDVVELDAGSKFGRARQGKCYFIFLRYDDSARLWGRS